MNFYGSAHAEYLFQMPLNVAFICGSHCEKPVFRISDQVWFKQACLATETGLNIKIVHVANDVLVKQK